jgi:hypothetical protein
MRNQHELIRSATDRRPAILGGSGTDIGAGTLWARGCRDRFAGQLPGSELSNHRRRWTAICAQDCQYRNRVRFTRSPESGPDTSCRQGSGYPNAALDSSGRRFAQARGRAGWQAIPDPFADICARPDAGACDVRPDAGAARRDRAPGRYASGSPGRFQPSRRRPAEPMGFAACARCDSCISRLCGRYGRPRADRVLACALRSRRGAAAAGPAQKHDPRRYHELQHAGRAARAGSVGGQRPGRFWRYGAQLHDWRVGGGGLRDSLRQRARQPGRGHGDGRRVSPGGATNRRRVGGAVRDDLPAPLRGDSEHRAAAAPGPAERVCAGVEPTRLAGAAAAPLDRPAVRPCAVSPRVRPGAAPGRPGDS